MLAYYQAQKIHCHLALDSSHPSSRFLALYFLSYMALFEDHQHSSLLASSTEAFVLSLPGMLYPTSSYLQYWDFLFFQTPAQLLPLKKMLSYTCTAGRVPVLVPLPLYFPRCLSVCFCCFVGILVSL